MKTLTRFHNNILRGILKLSRTSPLPPLYFLLGELPIEAVLHMDLLTLFWNIWANTNTKAHEIVKYLLMMSNSNSLTWAAHVRLIFQLYQLPDPLLLLNSQLWPKNKWKLHTKTVISAHHESVWRSKAAVNSKLSYLNTQAAGLSGRMHPLLTGILTTQDVIFSRIHIKMVSGDYNCYYYLDRDRGIGAYCRLCSALTPELKPPDETMVHLLTRCRSTVDTRTRILPDLLNTVSQDLPDNDLLSHHNHDNLTQFILDPTSLNLPLNIRVSPDHPALVRVLQVCRRLCYSLHKDRTRKLKQLGI